MPPSEIQGASNSGLPIIPILGQAPCGSSIATRRKGVCFASGDQKKFTLWLKPRKQSVHPKLEQAPSTSKGPEDVEVALQQLNQTSSHLQCEDFFYTPKPNGNIWFPDSSNLPSFPAATHPNTLAGFARVPTFVTLKPRAAIPRRIILDETIASSLSPLSSMEELIIPKGQ